jgi:hypothetical protein
LAWPKQKNWPGIDPATCVVFHAHIREMNNCLIDYYRCPERYVRLALNKDYPVGRGYFCFGENGIYFGNYYGHKPASRVTDALFDGGSDAVVDGGVVSLRFDPAEVIENLRQEVYAASRTKVAASLITRAYYLLRPFLSVGVRSKLQRIHLREWKKLSFPQWPVDSSVDLLHERLLLLSLRASGAERIPFIWFWPEGKAGCAIMTHDVETTVGRDFCTTLMDIDDSFGIKSSFQVVPEERYVVSPEYLNSIRERGFEVVVHDLNHDGRLFKDREIFLKRAAKINSYGAEYGAKGFRAAVLYRKQLWYDALRFSYDMSVPNVAHLDPQRGGCCTVMPYFLGDILEIPVTTIQDYTLFNILHDYSIDVWKQQIDLIMARHGLMSFIVHPDYVIEQREREVYQSLLKYLATLRDEQSLWVTTPGEIDRWWRQRAEMQVVETQGGWSIEGYGKERASLAWASEVDGRLVLTRESRDAQEPQYVQRTWHQS